MTAPKVSMAEKSDYANLYSPNQSERTGAWWIRGLGWNTSTRVKPYYNARGIYCWRWYADGHPEYDPDRMKAFANDTGIGVCPGVTVELSKLGFYVRDIEVSEAPATKEPVYSKRPPVVSKEPEISKEPIMSGSIGSSVHPTAVRTGSPGISDKPLPSESTVKGDLDGDGKVDLSDTQLVLKATLKIMVPDEAGQKAADVDGDGKVTLADAQLVLKMALKIIV